MVVGVRDVVVEGGVAVHREPAGVGEDVADGAPLLAGAPAVDVVGDAVVEPEPALLPELEHRDRGQRLARGVPEHHVVGAQRPPGLDFADGDVEQRLAAHRDVALGAVVTAFGPLALEDLDDHGRVDRFPSGLRSIKSGGHCAEAYGGGRASERTTERPDEQCCRGRTEGLASRPVGPVRVALLGWRLDQPRGQFRPPPASSVLPPADTPVARHARSSPPVTPHPARSAAHYDAGLPKSESELAVLRAVEAGRARCGGLDIEPRRVVSRAPAPRVRQPRTAPWPAVVRWFRSFADEPESYHSPKAGVALEPHSDQISILAATPANYGRAGLVALAACGVGIGAYLPWLSGTIDGLPFERTGLQLGHAWGFTWLAGALALAALLGVRVRVLRWVNMALAIVVAALVARELVDVNQQINHMNAAALVNADVGIGLWIMLVSAAGRAHRFVPNRRARIN